jgi:hypothetical protein
MNDDAQSRKGNSRIALSASRGYMILINRHLVLVKAKKTSPAERDWH